MKVAILAGGMGTRLAEETEVRPKPMVEIGGYPLLWHIMNIYSHFGFNEFVVALGYKGDYIKRWMSDFCTMQGSMTFNTATGAIKSHGKNETQWIVDLVDTGLNTMTGGRIKRLRDWVGDDTFMLTWGDGVADIDINKLLDFHRSHGKLATMTAVRPQARYGHLEFDGNRICSFTEKPQTSEGWINGAFFVLEPGIFDYIEGDHIMWEQAPLENLAKDNQLMAYKHESYWQCMDTLREKHLLQKLWDSGNPPWKIWS
ncbi:MAG: glucose-1-phosphate cytidylyltransferase [Gammaproteobacteria bacterium]